MEETITRFVEDLIGTPCSRAENPYGSILSLDFGALGTRPGDSTGAKPHGWRHLTISSPWRVQNESQILFDWNVDGGTDGLLPQLVLELVGREVKFARTTPPAWDLEVQFDDGLKLIVFGDCDDDRDEAWFILGTDGAKAVARPNVRPLARIGQ